MCSATRTITRIPERLTLTPTLTLHLPLTLPRDFFVIGVQILITGLLGIPPVNGLIPQAPLHTDSLCDKKFVEDADGNKIEVIVGCHEQRVSGLSQALGFGFGLANPNPSPSPNPNPNPNPNQACSRRTRASCSARPRR